MMRNPLAVCLMHVLANSKHSFHKTFLWELKWKSLFLSVCTTSLHFVPLSEDIQHPPVIPRQEALVAVTAICTLTQPSCACRLACELAYWEQSAALPSVGHKCGTLISKPATDFHKYHISVVLRRLLPCQIWFNWTTGFKTDWAKKANTL